MPQHSDSLKQGISQKLVELNEPIDYEKMMSYIEMLTERYSFLSFTSIGETMLGRCIPLLSVGEGKKEVLYIGAHRASDRQDISCFLRFLNELCELVSTKSKIYFYDSAYLYKTKTINIIPMLNPDGIDYNINGTDENNPLYERVKAMNKQSVDFSTWESNARGVDLDKNYLFPKSNFSEAEDPFLTSIEEGREGEWPESEREIGSLCNFLRYNSNIKLVLSTYSGSKEAIYLNQHPDLKNKAKKIAQFFRREVIEKDQCEDLTFGLSKWCEINTQTPVISLINAKNNSSVPYFSKYIKMREGLFTLPMMI